MARTSESTSERRYRFVVYAKVNNMRTSKAYGKVDMGGPRTYQAQTFFNEQTRSTFNLLSNTIREASSRKNLQKSMTPLLASLIESINKKIPEVVSRTSKEPSGLLASSRVLAGGATGTGWILRVQTAARYARVLEQGREEQFGTPEIDWHPTAGSRKHRWSILGSRGRDFWVPLAVQHAKKESIQSMRDRHPNTFIIPKVYNSRYLLVFEKKSHAVHKARKARMSQGHDLTVTSKGPLFAIYVGLPRVVPTRWLSTSIAEAVPEFTAKVQAEGTAMVKRIFAPLFAL